MSTYIVFGLAGVGKTYFATLAGKKFNLHVEDADHWLTDDMRECIKSGRIFTPEMLDNYFNIVSDKITQLKKSHADIIISQAMYLEKNRQQLLAAHPDICFILISANENVVANRLVQRGNAVTLQYAKDNASYFENPQHSFVEIDNSQNNSESHLLNQCRQLGLFTQKCSENIICRLFKPAIQCIQRSVKRYRNRP